jgi:murein DD-endopeptidase MepM/ murein hydrolase activator NlpD
VSGSGLRAVGLRALKLRTRQSLWAGAFLLLSAPGGAAQTLNNSGIPVIATAPERLANGSPFLLSVKLASKASALKGTFTGRPILFFQSKSDSGKTGGANTWYALAGVDVETEPGTYPLEVESTVDGKVVKTMRQIQVAAASYRTGTLKVPENFVAPDAATQKEIAEDKEIKDRVFAHSAPAPQWSGDFVKPVRALSTDSFGTRRTFNGKLASIHRGMDFRAAAGTFVAAANSGKVVLARHLFYEGNCVVVDHGQGFMTIYMHLSRFEVAEGTTISKGQRLGLSGATGRVTGPHLHFAARWQGAYVDPAGLFALPLAGQP